MRGGSRRKGARDAGTQSPRARVGSPASPPRRRVRTSCRAVGEGSAVSVAFPAQTWPAGEWWESVPPGLGLEQPGPRSCGIPGGI